MTDANTPPRTGTRAGVIAGALRSIITKCVAGVSCFALATALCHADAPAKDPYPAMAPLDQYLMPRDAEIALARSAAPEAISKDAEVLVLERDGFKTAVPGTNGFVCVVERAWTSPSDSPEFWNPKGRGPICWNTAGAEYCLPLLHKITQMVLAGKSKAEIIVGMKAALDAGEFPRLGAGAMCYMMSREGQLNDAVGHWHPHLMFFLPVEQASAWGANQPGSPIFGQIDDLRHVAILMVPVRRWSNASPDLEQALDCVPTPSTPAK
jgi:hypothetical protein